MVPYVFKLPDIGEGIAEAEIIHWHVKVGDTVKEDQPLVDVMTRQERAEVTVGIVVAVIFGGGGIVHLQHANLHDKRAVRARRLACG